MLGSYIDLAKLMPRFADVICASGKDYIVLAFSPASLAVNQRIDALAPEDAGAFPTCKQGFMLSTFASALCLHSSLPQVVVNLASTM